MTLGEFELIDRLLKPLAAGYPGALGLEDDAALVDVPAGHQLVIAKDAIVAGVHFLPTDPPGTVAAKVLGVNLSDLAAMGALPLAYLSVIARPTSLDEAWLELFTAALGVEQRRHGLHLIGGDTVSTTGPLLLSITILGVVPNGMALRRRGARPGDRIFVSGTVGDAALGLRILQGLAASEEASVELIERYRVPRPRLALGVALRGLATAAIDISDGLVADLGHVTTASNVGAVIRATDLPMSAAADELPGALTSALMGGDDYELLFTVSPSRVMEVQAISAGSGLPLTAIGEIVEAPGITILDRDGRPIAVEHGGWRHF